MMMVKTDQSSKEANCRQEYQRRRKARHESHMMDVALKASRIVQAKLNKKAKMRPVGKEGDKVGGKSGARGNQWGFLKQGFCSLMAYFPSL